ncbi:hypothetical protein [Subtercola vilae]|uniref:hypothetical protein n=1 Tax=Subtercola vilae TaxID=2056433 RepID=UPI0010AA7888|nr:hypothetical protein [Subtercola vilae]
MVVLVEQWRSSAKLASDFHNAQTGGGSSLNTMGTVSTAARMSGLKYAEAEASQHLHASLKTISVDAAWVSEVFNLGSAALGFVALESAEVPPVAIALEATSILLNKVGTVIGLVGTAAGCMDSFDTLCITGIGINGFGFLISGTPAGPVFSSLVGGAFLIPQGWPRWQW